ncbi:MAG: apolipoprotein N-acyltransferase [Candidatus Binatia bacterium]|nr:apolipoprotein N-acyltransferase [Candidatus Binatia bacterium]
MSRRFDHENSTLTHRQMRRTSLPLVLLSGLLIAAPFLHLALYFSSWISLVPLFGVLRRTIALRDALFIGLLTGLITNLIGFYWLIYTIKVFGGLPSLLSGFVFFLFALYSAIPFAVLSLLVRRYGFGPFCLLPPLFWIAIEFWFPLLFPWHLANGQSHLLPLMQSADLVGPYGTSFLLVWVNALIFQIAKALFSQREKIRSSLLQAAFGAAALITVLLYGHVRLGVIATKISAAPSLSVALVQGNISIHRKGKIALLESNLENYKKLTKKIKGANLVIWPESAVGAWVLEERKELPPHLAASLPAESSFFVFGARSFTRSAAHANVKTFNSAFLTNNRGHILSRYHKQVLLAFGETLPFAPLLSKLPWMPPIGDGFTRGEGPRTLDLSSKTKLAPLICYEDLMPRLARRFVKERGANVLVNLTNNAWFGPTAAPWQHARLSQWRAIETRRSLVRATNSGLTAVIDPRGEILETLPTFSSGVLQTKVPIMEGQTIYVRFGDWFAWLATLLSLLVLVVRRQEDR